MIGGSALSSWTSITRYPGDRIRTPSFIAVSLGIHQRLSNMGPHPQDQMMDDSFQEQSISYRQI